MSGILPLRDYQQAAIDALYAEWDKGTVRTAVVLPTGAGKTVVFAHLVRRFLAENPGCRAVILVHTDELVSQAARKLRAIAPNLTVGIVKAQQDEVAADVIVGSVQTLRGERRHARVRRVGLVIVDECHHAVARSYRVILDAFGSFRTTRTAGFTATLARGDKEKLSDIWQNVAFRRDIHFMIRRGYLLDVVGRRVEIPDLELDKVRRSGGDYASGSLGEALEASLAPGEVAEACLQHMPERTTLLFAPTVSSAYTFEAALRDRGVKAETVHGGLPMPERRAVLERLESGATQLVCNCMVLTEGFDAPVVSGVIVARPTRSAPLYQQMVGRALRPYPGQTEAMILDVVGASLRHDLASLVDLSEKKIRDPYDGPTFADMVDEAIAGEGEGMPDSKTLWTGETVVTEFDPLARDSKRQWNKTYDGIWFLSVGSYDGKYIFLLPSTLPGAEPGSWDVIWASKDSYRRTQGATEHRGLSLELAFAWAEDHAAEAAQEYGLDTLNRTASWRRGKQPSEKQLVECRRRGIVVPAGARKGDVSDLIDIDAASHRVDPIARWAAQYTK